MALKGHWWGVVLQQYLSAVMLQWWGGDTLQRSVPSGPFERCAEAQGVTQGHTASKW